MTLSGKPPSGPATQSDGSFFSRFFRLKNTVRNTVVEVPARQNGVSRRRLHHFGQRNVDRLAMSSRLLPRVAPLESVRVPNRPHSGSRAGLPACRPSSARPGGPLASRRWSRRLARTARTAAPSRQRRASAAAGKRPTATTSGPPAGQRPRSWLVIDAGSDNGAVGHLGLLLTGIMWSAAADRPRERPP